MPELDLFEVRLTRAVRSFADRADTRVDPVAVADRAIGHRRFASLSWLGHTVPVPVSILLVLGLLLALLAWSVGVGAPWDQRTSIVLLPAPTAAPTVTAAPTARPLPSTDGTGYEYVNGTGTFSIVDPGTSVEVGDMTHERGFVASSTDTMNDPRVTGTGALRLSIDTFDGVGSEWGTYRLENTDGSWEGTVSGGGWSDGEAGTITGWLVGSGAYAGWTYYIDMRSSGLQTELSGVIYPGSPPARQSPEAR
jgi:hypothetical protein